MLMQKAESSSQYAVLDCKIEHNNQCIQLAAATVLLLIFNSASMRGSDWYWKAGILMKMICDSLFSEELVTLTVQFRPSHDCFTLSPTRLLSHTEPMQQMQHLYRQVQLRYEDLWTKKAQVHFLSQFFIPFLQ